MSPKGAVGLYQVMPSALEDYNYYNKEKLTRKDLFNPNINHRVANWYMNIRVPALLKNYKIKDSVVNRLAAYNWGAKNLKKKGLGKAPKETLFYIKNYQKFEKGKENA